MTSLRGNSQRASDLRRQRTITERTEKNESYQAAEDDALARLREAVVPGQRIYTILDHINRSQTQRQIKVVAVAAGQAHIMTLTAEVALVLGYPLSRNGRSMHVRGGGSDMGFQIVMQLSRVLWPGEHQRLEHSWL